MILSLLQEHGCVTQRRERLLHFRQHAVIPHSLPRIRCACHDYDCVTSYDDAFAQESRPSVREYVVGAADATDPTVFVLLDTYPATADTTPFIGIDLASDAGIRNALVRSGISLVVLSFYNLASRSSSHGCLRYQLLSVTHVDSGNGCAAGGA